MFFKNARNAVPDNLIPPLETCASVLVWFVTSIVQITPPRKKNLATCLKLTQLPLTLQL